MARSASITTTTTPRLRSNANRFREQIQLARELKLPVIIHTREAQEDTVAYPQGGTGLGDRRSLSLFFRRCLAGKGCA